MQSKLHGADCAACPLGPAGRPVPSEIPLRPRFVILGEQPGPTEAREGRPYAGPAGRESDGALAACGVRRGEVAHANVIACHEPRRLGPKEWAAAAQACSGRLALDLAAADRKGRGDGGDGAADHRLPILAHGRLAAIATVGKMNIQSWAGGVMDGAPGGVAAGRRVVVTYNPAFVLRLPVYRPVLQIHTQRLAAVASPSWRPPSWPQTITHLADGWDAVETGLRRVLALAEAGEDVGLDVETAGIRLDDALVDVALAVAPRGRPDSDGLAVSFHWRSAPLAVRDLTRSVISAAAGGLTGGVGAGRSRLVLQNGQFDAVVLERHAGIVLGHWQDTLAAHQILMPLVFHDLGFIACIELPHERWKTEYKALGEDLWSASEKAAERALYNARDAWATVRIWRNLRARLEGGDQRHQRSYARLLGEHRMAAAMRKRGVAIDLDEVAAQNKVLRKKIAASTRRCRRLARDLGFGRFRPGSSAHVFKVMVAIGEPSEAKPSESTGKRGYDAVELTRIASADGPGADLAAALLEDRGFRKLHGTYIRDLPQTLDRDGRLRIGWRPGLVSGRWAGFPLMTIPKKMRTIVKAGPGHTFVGFDLRQGEVYMLGLLSQDPVMLATLAAGGDFHRQNTAKILGVDPAAVTDAQRAIGKGVQFAVAYGASVDVVYDQVRKKAPEVNKALVAQAMKDYKRKHKVVAAFQAETKQRARYEGCVWADNAELRYPLPDEIEEPVCCNFPIQTELSHVVRLLMEQLAEALPVEAPGAAIVVNLHDELLIETPIEHEAAVVALVKRLTDRNWTLSGKTGRLPIDLKRGPNWGRMEAT